MDKTGEIRLLTGQRVVTAAGTPERLNEETSKYRTLVIVILIRAHEDNAGLIYVGDKTVSSTTCYRLSPGETLLLDVHDFKDGFIDLQNVWVDAAASGDGVSFSAFEVL